MYTPFNSLGRLFKSLCYTYNFSIHKKFQRFEKFIYIGEKIKFLAYWGTGGATKSSVPSQQNSRISLCKYSAHSRLIPLGETVGGKTPASRVVPFLRRLTALVNSNTLYKKQFQENPYGIENDRKI